MNAPTRRHLAKSKSKKYMLPTAYFSLLKPPPWFVLPPFPFIEICFDTYKSEKQYRKSNVMAKAVSFSMETLRIFSMA